MFSGIVQHLGLVQALAVQPESAVITLASKAFERSVLAAYPLRIGDSVCVSGVCLTVVDFSEEKASFDVASETLRRTTLGSLREGQSCHLERSLRLGDSLDGHLVFGHVDTTTTLLSADWEGETLRLSFLLPLGLSHLFAEKGSVAIDGVSLTVGGISDSQFSVYIIPHTLERTNFRALAVGSNVNIEVDMLARYVARILRKETCRS